MASTGGRPAFALRVGTPMVTGNSDASEARGIFLSLAGVIRASREILVLQLQGGSMASDPAVQAHWAETLHHLSQVRKGFMLTFLLGPGTFPSVNVSDLTQLQALVKYILIDWSWFEELGLSWLSGTQIERLEGQVISYAHARIALGIVPWLPPEAVTFPQPYASYAGVPVPRTAGELLTRIEEWEQVIQHDLRRKNWGLNESVATAHQFVGQCR